jgi:NAD(P)-dependent dehydrogenase (short-subunit alcohol dehydrogenase family)
MPPGSRSIGGAARRVNAMAKPIVLVTGAGRRIGAAIARDRAARGWHPIIHCNRAVADAERLAAEIRAAGGSCDTICADLGVAAELERIVPECNARVGRIDCLINNASLFQYDSIDTLERDLWERHLAANLTGPAFLARDFARQLPEGAEGAIINLLDQKVGNLNPDFLSYTVSKVGLKGLTEILAIALAPRIRVCGIAPGVTLISGKQTQASYETAVAATLLGRSSTVDEIVAAVEFIITTRSLTGQTLTVDGGESLVRRKRDIAFDVDP